MFRKTIALTLVAVLVAAAGSALTGNAEAFRPGQKPIYPLAKEAGLNTLVAAVKAAGLQGTLASGGPFTVFAPTDEAFAALGEETLNAVLADKELLTRILLYHVATEELSATDVLARSSISMANGESITVDAGNVKVNDSNIVATDVLARNGIVHVIDTVLLPPSLTASMRVDRPALSSTTAASTEVSTWSQVKSQYR